MTAFDRVLEVAVDNHGYLTVADAVAAGIDPAQLRKLAATGRLEHSAHGLYRVPVLAAGPHAPYAEAVAWTRGRGVISHESALDLLELCDVNPPVIHITVPREYAPRRRGGELYRIWRRTIDPAIVTHVDGVPVVRAANSIQDCLAYGTDTRLLLQACRAGRREGYLTEEQMYVLEAQVQARRQPTRRPPMHDSSNAKPSVPPSNLTSLRARLRNHARDIRQVETRVQRRLATLVLNEIFLAADLDIDGPPVLIKGGTAIDLRRGMATARLSKDLDAAVRGDIDGFITQARTLLDAGWCGFTGRLARETEINVPGLLVKPRRFDVKLDYLGKPFATVPVELSRAEGRSGDEHDQITVDEYDTIGLAPHGPVHCLSLRYQIAQKIHACTDPLDDVGGTTAPATSSTSSCSPWWSTTANSRQSAPPAPRSSPSASVTCGHQLSESGPPGPPSTPPQRVPSAMMSFRTSNVPRNGSEPSSAPSTAPRSRPAPAIHRVPYTALKGADKA